ncbi:MAG: polyprenyl synthetase family protein [Deltaproteobacteria bacterium]|nr:polyprenyl synthetase family protein [Deltaproteobacteria bacterium]
MSPALAQASKSTPTPPDPLTVLEDHMRRDLALAPGVLGEVAREAIAAGGKRVRPQLVYLAHEACGGDAEGWPTCGVYATAVEYLHTATLLHDDLIDGATLRRGQEAAYRRFGPKEAVLSGDLLLARCLMHITSPGDPAAVSALARAAERVAVGEAMEVELTRDPGVDRDRYLHYATSKTGALFAAALELGARAAGAPEAQVAALAAFGESVGLAFQIADDLLDVIGEEARTGKRPGLDLLAGVPSLPVVEALDALGPERGEVVAQLLSGDAPESTLADALRLVAEHGVEPCVARARELVDEAKASLEQLPLCDARLELARHAEKAVERLS